MSGNRSSSNDNRAGRTSAVPHTSTPLEARGLLASIVRSSDDAILSKTLDGVISSWNQAAERLYGYSAEEAIGMPVSKLIPPDRGSEFTEILAKVRAGERVDHFETSRLRKDGTRVAVSVTISPVLDGTGTIVGASSIARDISERRRLDEERTELLRREQQTRLAAEQAYREARQAVLVRDEFLSVAAHELKTPMAGLLGYAQLLQRLQHGDGASARKPFSHIVERLVQQTRKLSRLVDQLLDVSRLDARRLALDVRVADVAEIAEGVLQMMCEQTGREMTIDAERPALAFVDAGRVEQVLVNLLDNAVRYSPPESPVRLELSARPAGWVQLAVRDYGPGVPPEQRGRLFDRFTRLEGADHRGGLGLGLYISRQIAEFHGGRLEAEFPAAGGSRFVLTVPAPSAGPRAGNRAARVLIVDDDPVVRELVSEVLEKEGYEVQVARDGAEGLEKLRAWEPGAILLDMKMPGMDGWTFAARYAEVARRRAPIAVMTAARDAPIRASEVRADAFIPKPFDLDELLTTVARLARPALNSSDRPS